MEANTATDFSIAMSGGGKFDYCTVACGFLIGLGLLLRAVHP